MLSRSYEQGPCNPTILNPAICWCSNTPGSFPIGTVQHVVVRNEIMKYVKRSGADGHLDAQLNTERECSSPVKT